MFLVTVLIVGSRQKKTQSPASLDSNNQSDNLAAWPSNLERQFILDALLQDLRVDGRQFNQYRPIDLAFGDEYGSVRVSIGKTKYGKTFANIRLAYEMQDFHANICHRHQAQ